MQWTWIYYLICITAALARKATYKFAYTNASTTHNPKYVSFFTVAILPQAPGTIFELEYEVRVNYTKNPVTTFSMHMLAANNTWRSLMTLDFDYCSMAGSKTRNSKIDMTVSSVFSYWVAQARKNTNMPKCPIRAGRYKLKNEAAVNKDVPPFVPSGRYRVISANYFKDPIEPIKTFTLLIDLQRKA